MELLLIILIAIGLMVGIIYGLRRYRKVELEKNADRYNPLPPLDEDGTSKLNISKDLDSLGPTNGPLNDGLENPDLPEPGASRRATDSQHRQDQNPQPTGRVAASQPRKHSSSVRIVKREHATNQTRPAAADAVATTATNKATNTRNFNPSGHTSSQTAVAPSPASRPITRPVSAGIPQAVISKLAATPADLEIIQTESRMPEPESQADKNLPDQVRAKAAVSAPAVEASSPPPALDVTARASAINKSWQDRVAELKREGQLKEALAVCAAEYPLWGAYSQASIIVRALLKDEQDKQRLETGLRQLYDLAAQAELLHEKIADNPGLSGNQLKKLELEKLAELDLPYQTVGYRKLRLLKKTDLKLLIQQWGEPANHQSPREHCREQWQALIAIV